MSGAHRRETAERDRAAIAFGDFVPGVIDAPDDLTVPPFYDRPVPLPPPAPPLFAASPLAKPAASVPPCPLIIEVGRGLRHRARTRVVVGHAACR